MATSNTYLFNPDLAEMFDDAFERIGLNPETLDASKIQSATRSANFLFKEWEAKGVHSWAIESVKRTLSVGEIVLDIPTEAVSIMGVSLIRDDVSTPMQALGMGDYRELVDKTMTGRPDRYYANRLAYRPELWIWPMPENDTDQLDIWYFRQQQDAGNMTNTLDMPSYYQEAFASGLAAKLAEKFAPARLSEKVQLANMQFETAKMEDGSRADFDVRVQYP